MAFVEKLFGTFSESVNPSGTQKNFRVSFLFEGFSGTATEVKMGTDSFQIEDVSTNDTITGIKEQRANIQIVGDDTLTAADFYTENEKNIKVELYDTTGTSTLAWAGYVTPKRVEDPFHDGKRHITITAGDGISFLNSEDFLDGNGAYYDTSLTHLFLLRHCLGFTGLDLNFNTVGSLRRTGHDASGAFEPMAFTYANYSGFKGKTVLEVLGFLCEQWNAVLFQEDGQWFFIRSYDLKSGTVYYRSWDSDLNYLTGGAWANPQTVAFGGALQTLDGLSGYDQSFKKLTGTVKFGEYLNRLSNYDFSAFASGSFTNWSEFFAPTVTQEGAGTAIDPYLAKLSGVSSSTDGAGLLYQIYEIGTDDEALNNRVVFSGKVYTQDVKGVVVRCNCVIIAGGVTYAFGLNDSGKWIRSGGGGLVVRNLDPNGKSKTSAAEWSVSSDKLSNITIYNLTTGAEIATSTYTKVQVEISLYEGIEATSVNVGGSADPWVKYDEVSIQVVNVAINLNTKSIRYEVLHDEQSPKNDAFDYTFADLPDSGQSAALLSTDTIATTGDWITTADGTEREMVFHLLQEILQLYGRPSKTWDGTIRGRVKRRYALTIPANSERWAVAKWGYNFGSAEAENIRLIKFPSSSPTLEFKKYAILSDGSEQLALGLDLPSSNTGQEDAATDEADFEKNLSRYTNTPFFETGRVGLTKTGNESTTALDWLDGAGLVLDSISPVTDGFFLKAEGWGFGLTVDASALTADAVGSLPALSTDFEIATNLSAWMLGATNIAAEKLYLGTASGDFDLGIKRAGTEILTVKSTGLDVTGKLTATSDSLINGLRIGKGNGAIASNTAFGALALNANTTGTYNVGIGYTALTANNTGYYNTALGGQALKANTTGDSNTAIGLNVLYKNITGNNNTAIGAFSAQNTTTGAKNVALGGALQSNATGDYNTALGYQCLHLATGGFNLGVGSFSLYDVTTGVTNIGIGYNTGRGITTGSGNTIIGHQITGLSASLTNTLVLGAAGRKDIYATATGVGINNTNPAYRLHTIGTTSTTDLNITSGAIVGYAWKCTNATTGAGAWTSIATSERWMGTWDASSGSAPSGSPTNGDYYTVTTGGTYSGVTYAVNDYSYYNGTSWVYRPNGYTLVTATSSIKGGIKIGTTLNISSEVVDLKSGIATAGTYRSLTVDTYGRVTGGTNPTTISGYGITDYDSLWDTRLATKSTTDLTEGLSLYFTNARVIATGLKAYVSGAGTISAADSILGAIQKLNGKFGAVTTDYYPKWDGSKFVDGLIFESGGALGVLGDVALSNKDLSGIDKLTVSKSIDIRSSKGSTYQVLANAGNTGGDGSIFHEWTTLNGANYLSDWETKVDKTLILNSTGEFIRDDEDMSGLWLSDYSGTVGFLGKANSLVGGMVVYNSKTTKGLHLADDGIIYYNSKRLLDTGDLGDTGGGTGTPQSIDNVLAVGNIAIDKTIEFKQDTTRDILQFKKKVDNTLLGAITYVPGTTGVFDASNRVLLQNYESTIELGLRADGKAQMGDYTTDNYILTDFGTSVKQTFYNGGTPKAVVDYENGFYLNTAFTTLQGVGKTTIESQDDVELISGFNAGDSASNVKINSNTTGGTLGGVEIGRASGTNYINLNGRKYNFHQGTTPSDGDQVVFVYDSATASYYANKITTSLAVG